MKARETPNRRVGRKLPSTAKHLNFTYKCIQQIIISGCASLLVLPGIKPATLQSRVQCSITVLSLIRNICSIPSICKGEYHSNDGLILSAFLRGEGRGGELRSCVRVEVAVLGSPSLINKPYGFCGHKATLKKKGKFGAQELCARWGGHPGLPVPNKPMVSVDVKQHRTGRGE